VVRKWRRFQAEHDEIVPLAPRCDWQASGQDIRDRSRVNTLDWFAEYLNSIMSNLYAYTHGSDEFLDIVRSPPSCDSGNACPCS
jgi:hypothetical protein